MEFIKQFTNEPEDYYVYLHVRATDGKPFYVGKGKNKRYLNTFDRNTFWKRTAKKYGVAVIIVQDKLQEWAAFELEKDMISLYGRRNNGQGCLTNLSDGGEGQSGYTHTDESKEKVSAKLRGRYMSTEHRAKIGKANENRVLSDVARKKMSDARKGRFSGENHPLFGKKKSQESVERTAEANRLKVQCIDTGQVFQSVSEAALWANTTTSQISRVCKGKQKTCKGTSWKYFQEDNAA